MKRKLDVQSLSWEMSEPFTISRGSMSVVDCILVKLTDHEGRVGRGEATGVPYHGGIDGGGETPAFMINQIEDIRGQIEDGVSRLELLSLLNAGGARNALDAAMWDLEAKILNRPVWEMAGLKKIGSLVTAHTIGIRSLEEYRRKASELKKLPLLKIKVSGNGDLEVIKAVHNAAPNSDLIVDPNQSWTAEYLRAITPELVKLSVVLLEQPVSAEADDELLGQDFGLPICADEAINNINDLPKIQGKYSHINIKLDKTGGLTEALHLAREASRLGLKLMTGCMAGSSLAMAPAAIIGQMSEFVDLDGPLLQKDDWQDGISYVDGVMSFPAAKLWG